MRSRLVLLVVVAACGYPPIEVTNDAGVNVKIDAAPMCFGSITSICFDPSVVPTTAKTLATIDIDTDSIDPAMCDLANHQKASYCVVAGAGLDPVSWTPGYAAISC
jgi:hypothetical protein